MTARTLGLALLATLTLAAPASATTVTVEPIDWGEGTTEFQLRVTAAKGERNDIRVGFSARHDTWRVVEKGAPLTAGPGCDVVGDEAICARYALPSKFLTPSYEFSAAIDLGDGDDEAVIEPAHYKVELSDGTGADEISVLDRAGPVYITDGAGPDVIHSDNPSTRVLFGDRKAGVTFTPDGRADDGQAGERDNITGQFDTVRGTRYSDKLAAGAWGSTIDGVGGSDTLIGGPGKDRIRAGTGSSDIEAGGGDDIVEMWIHADRGRISGGPGSDTLRVGRGENDDSAFTSISLDGLANDGFGDALGTPFGKADVDADFEIVDAGRGRAVGSDDGESITASLFADGGAGDDVVTGGGDTGGGRAVVIGGPGRDVLSFERTRSGTVTALARDGERDVIDCRQSQPDVLEADSIDSAAGCAPTMRWVAPSRVLRPDRRGYVSIKVACRAPSDIPCDGRVSIAPPANLRKPLSTSPVFYARASFDGVRVAARRTIRVKVAAHYRAELERGHTVTGALVAETMRAVPYATRTTELGKVTLKPRRR